MNHAVAATPLRVALAGAGRMACHHARAIAFSGVAARLVGVADPDPASRAGVLQLWREAQGFDSLEALLAALPVDVVHVCTPPSTHVRLATAALEAGCHVYVEKPFAESSEGAEQVLALAAARGLSVCAGHQYLFEQPALRAQTLLPALGELVHVESWFAFAPTRRGPGGRAPLSADAQLLDILPHPVYLLERFLRLADPAAEPKVTALELGPAGTVHALVRCGGVTGSLVVTLAGRPVQHHLRLVGTQGMVHGDFVVGTVQRLLGPGTSGIDKALAPFLLARQLVTDATHALGARVLRRQRSYPGLVKIIETFYGALRSGGPPPVSPQSILATQGLCDRIAAAITRTRPEPAAAAKAESGPAVAVTGGLGFLGGELVRTLAIQGATVRVLTRRAPAPWERVPGVEYVVTDLGDAVPETALRGAEVVVHCAAETGGGWDAHRRNSIEATRNLLKAAAAAGVTRLVHVSSLAVLAGPGPRSPRGAPDEGAPLASNPRERGPYVWGKLESERLAARLGTELGVEVKVVRPGPIVEARLGDSPGRLGRRVGPVFVAVGSPRDRVAVVDRAFAARTLAWLALHFAEAPRTLHLISPTLPTKRDLIVQLRRANPGLAIVWLPRILLLPLAWVASALQKIRHPGAIAVNVAAAFAPQEMDPSLIRSLEPLVLQSPSPSPSLSPPRSRGEAAVVTS